MANLSGNPWIKHLIAIIIFIGTALIYFYPTTFQGKVIGNQTDRIQSIARQHEVREFKEQENRPIYWTNAIFSGMPTTLIGHGHPDSYDLINLATINVFRLFKKATTPYSLFFGGFLGMYLLLMVLKVDWRLAIGGAILYGLSTSHLLILEGGHFSKLQSIIFCPPFLASLILLLRGRIWIGTALLALFGSVLLRTGHVQVIFYFALIMGLYAVIHTVNVLRSGDETSGLIKKAGFIAIAAILAFLPNLYKMWALKSYGEESIRGKTELVQKDQPSDGLDKDYVFSWSMGKIESFSVLIPNIKGGTSSETFIADKGSESFKAIIGNPNANQLAQFTRQYWGDQPFVGGAYYYGVALVFLFLVSLFLVNASWRWWAISSMAIIVVLGWGRNLGAINFFLFENIPPFNKFRAVNMTFILGHIIIVLLGIKGLDVMLRKGRKKSWPAIKKGALLTAGLIVLGYALGTTVGLEGPNDSIIESQERFLNALRADRAALVQADAIRAFMVLVVIFLLAWAWVKNLLKSQTVIMLALIVAFLDVLTINLRYVYPDKFVEKRDFDQAFKPRQVDKQILKDEDLHYRVFDLSTGDPFNNNISSYHHSLVGGYHPAKLRRYQEVIERYLSKPDKFTHVFDMLNTKYFIQNQGNNQAVAMVNEKALGNAWFVDTVMLVDNANEEIKAIAKIKPGKEAIMNRKFVDEGMATSFSDAGKGRIELTNYVPDHLTYEYSTDKERLVVFSEVYYPESKGWKVYLDGEERMDLKRANYILNAALVPAGDHSLELRFEPNGTTTILSLSRLGSILLTLLVLFMFYQMYKNSDKLTWMPESITEPEPKPETKRVRRVRKQ